MLTRMILDRLDNPSAVAALPPRLRAAVDFLRRGDLTSLAPGRHVVDGDRLFAIVDDYTTLPSSECRWEAHRAYIDVQYVVHGVERMGFMNISRAIEREPYNESKDVAFFEPGDDVVTVHAGMFTVFGPEDVHAPKIAAHVPARVRKIVMKVAVEEIT